jgi:hypothetical protein
VKIIERGKRVKKFTYILEAKAKDMKENLDTIKNVEELCILTINPTQSFFELSKNSEFSGFLEKSIMEKVYLDGSVESEHFNSDSILYYQLEDIQNVNFYLKH